MFRMSGKEAATRGGNNWREHALAEDMPLPNGIPKVGKARKPAAGVGGGCRLPGRRYRPPF